MLSASPLFLTVPWHPHHSEIKKKLSLNSSQNRSIIPLQQLDIDKITMKSDNFRSDLSSRWGKHLEKNYYLLLLFKRSVCLIAKHPDLSRRGVIPLFPGTKILGNFINAAVVGKWLHPLFIGRIASKSLPTTFDPISSSFSDQRKISQFRSFLINRQGIQGLVCAQNQLVSRNSSWL